MLNEIIVYRNTETVQIVETGVSTDYDESKSFQDGGC